MPLDDVTPDQQRAALKWLYAQGPRYRATRDKIPSRHLAAIHLIAHERHPRRVGYYRNGYAITKAGLKFLADHGNQLKTEL